ncbi:methionyl-tRNA formyltransferase [Alkalihalobacterium alkalinitrilicum]|uniref:methionyl-tRNA formyltransferase n=1 Tax=Alkalihalobacterium alkalinitrilicum TaxID=427920 RepID=UPI001151F63E|nr:methionyl-tRNA formyltransferase [Alkalihalobacterium alkalinitrilicum]
MDKITRNSKVHDEVDAAYNVLEMGGKKYIQINTYGSKDRKAKGIVSQTIQLSEEAVEQLQSIIDKEFS